MDFKNSNVEYNVEYKDPLHTQFKPTVQINKIYEDAKLPFYGSKDAACADVYAYIIASEADSINFKKEPYIFIQPHETRLIHTGLRMAPEEGWFVRVYARSGLATKRGLAPANKTGIIDNDYRGELMVALHNHSDMAQIVSHGERIAQIEVAPYWQASFVETDALTDTERGNGGFGHSGAY